MTLQITAKQSFINAISYFLISIKRFESSEDFEMCLASVLQVLDTFFKNYDNFVLIERNVFSIQGITAINNKIYISEDCFTD